MNPRLSPSGLERVVDRWKRRCQYSWADQSTDTGSEQQCQPDLNLNLVAASAPVAENLAGLSAQLRGPGALGDGCCRPAALGQIAAALTNANTLLSNTDTNLALLVGKLSRSLDSRRTSRATWNSQVQANTNIVTSVSDAIVHTDDLIQGLKRHWLLRSAFRRRRRMHHPLRSRAHRAPDDRSGVEA